MSLKCLFFGLLFKNHADVFLHVFACSSVVLMYMCGGEERLLPFPIN